MNVCAAWKALRSFYDGTAERSKRTHAAAYALQNLFYKDEATFTFASFFTKATGYYKTLRESGEERTETEKVRWLDSHMQCNKEGIKIALEIALGKYPNSFEEAAQHVSGAVVRHNRNLIQTGGGKRKAIVQEIVQEDQPTREFRNTING